MLGDLLGCWETNVIAGRSAGEVRDLLGLRQDEQPRGVFLLGSDVPTGDEWS